MAMKVKSTHQKNKLHNHLGENMVRSIGVGATHWEERRGGGDMPGAKPEFFFAPAQIGKRNKDWGPGVLFQPARSSPPARRIILMLSF